MIFENSLLFLQFSVCLARVVTSRSNVLKREGILKVVQIRKRALIPSLFFLPKSSSSGASAAAKALGNPYVSSQEFSCAH